MSKEPPSQKEPGPHGKCRGRPRPEAARAVAQTLGETVLFCLACGSGEICACRLCRNCYDAAYQDDAYFAGAKARVLARDAHCCRVCGEVTNVVHRRKPEVGLEEWLITLCPACHATVERLERLDHYLSPLLLTLWREKHPDAGEQLAFVLETPLETAHDLQAAAG